MDKDAIFMNMALHLAAKGSWCTAPNPRVGCVIVRDGIVVGRGWHRGPGKAHAEVEALREAGDRARGACLYVNLDPCAHFGRTPPCGNAVVWSGIAEVVYAIEDPNPEVSGAGRARLQAAGIAVRVGAGSERAEALNRGFLTRMRTGMPFVRCKVALSLDGKIALRSGESRWITCASARESVHELRSACDAIVTGIGTVLADDPGMDARPSRMLEGGLEPALKVVLDSRLRMPSDARMLRTPGSTLVVTQSHERREDLPVEIVRMVDGESEQSRSLNLRSVLRELGRRGVNEVLIEAGATLVTEAARSGCVDEWVLYYGSKILGQGLSPFGFSHESMSDVRAMNVESVRPMGTGFLVRASSSVGCNAQAFIR